MNNTWGWVLDRNLASKATHARSPRTTRTVLADAQLVANQHEPVTGAEGTHPTTKEFTIFALNPSNPSNLPFMYSQWLFQISMLKMYS